MRKKYVKELAILGILSLLTQTKPVYAGWIQQDNIWRYEREGNQVRDSWVQEADGWYYLEGDGSMAMGWKQAGGFWYFLNPGPDGIHGRMMQGWQWIDGRCYYFAESGSEIFPEGAMYVNARTPDGYQVNESGAWVNEQGSLMEIPGKGILTQEAFGGDRQREERNSGPDRGSGRNSGGSSKSGGSSRSSKSSGSGRSSGSGGSGGSGGSSKSGGNSGNGGSSKSGGSSRSGESGGNIKMAGENKSEEIIQSLESSKDNQNLKYNQKVDNNRAEESSKESEKNHSKEEGKQEENVGVIKTATWSNAAMVDWKVCFVDEDTHQIALAEPRLGRVQDGESIVLNFRDRIVDQEDCVWEAVKKPPLKMEVYGPGNWIAYVEYRQDKRLEEPEAPDFGERERLQKWLEKAKEQEADLTGEDVLWIPDSRVVAENQQENEERLLTAAGQIPVFKEHVIYVIGKDYEPDGGILKNYYKDGIVYSKQVQDQLELEGRVYTITRFSVARNADPESCSHIWEIQTERAAGCVQKGLRIEQCGKCGEEKEKALLPLGHMDGDGDQICDVCKSDMEENGMESTYWRIGDALTGEIHGEVCSFRCIDQNYSDLTGNPCQGALFLCDSVIPANLGSSYSYDLLEDGNYGYVFHPGPIVNFGKSNDYKYSNIQKWLKEAEDSFSFAENLDLGVSSAYTGSTGLDMREQLRASDLKKIPIGNQKLTGKLFVLSVDEALKYRQWLWRLEGSEEENPESVCGAFSNGYWLRNPAGSIPGLDTGLVYAVDLVDGRIRPVEIAPKNGTGDEELCVTSDIGVRPAFVMHQG